MTQDRQAPPSAIPPLPPAPPAVAIADYLVFSILITLFCCLPLGIVGIVFASKANSLKARGDYAAALAASNTAKTWCWIGFGVGLALLVVSVIFAILMFVGMIATSGHM
jgi:hypothetical protein